MYTMATHKTHQYHEIHDKFFAQTEKYKRRARYTAHTPHAFFQKHLLSRRKEPQKITVVTT